MESYNIYCDESCHLENDKQKAMVLGAVWCPKSLVKDISFKIKDLKTKHGLNRNFEIKWIKVSPAKLDFYLELINFFFSSEFLHFRALIISDKSKLAHNNFNQTHDDWYYKMYFNLLEVIMNPKNTYSIYIDIKDTNSEVKVKHLHDILCNNVYDFSRKIIEKVQQIHSHEVEIMQLTDLLIGAVSYVNRNLNESSSKKEIVNLIREKSGYSLTKSTLSPEQKFNLFVWNPKEMISNV